ncbi:polysialyltransferase family glycosyltransferase [Streptomyces sp. NPDC049954]|uniref:polysialyltransferase family glycosyltransferase n=1 Tax=Streptomyces sp. NPDC049954 TaxID=3155779 RepID=UPI003448C674
MTTRIFLASTLYGTATLAAAIDAGAFAPVDRTILLLSNNAANPETTPGPDSMAGFGRLRSRFGEVRHWNEAIFPFHPGSWKPSPDDIPLWERYLRLLWQLGDDDVELVAESIQVVPALAVTAIFTGARIDVYADGLMSYGPTRIKLDPLIGTRISRLLHLDLVPGLRPLLLTEFGVEQELVPTSAFLAVLDELGEEAPELPQEVARAAERPALLLGQYLSALGILTAEEEEELHATMVRGAVQLGHAHLLFKPHPTAPARFSRRLEEEAHRLGVALTVLDVPVLAEVLYQRLRPALVVGCFSTALLTAASCYGLPVARAGTELLLERLAPYENSNRVPVTVVDALLPDTADRAAVEAQDLDVAGAGLQELLTAVGFAMQPKVYPGLRGAAEAYLARHLDDRTRRYFKRRRLTVLGLPGGVPQQLAFLPRTAAVRKVARRARALKRRAAGSK